MKFGVARQGPTAPSTRQFGKYDSLTSTGTPVRSTSNEIESSVVCTLVTCTGDSVRRGSRSAADPGARLQLAGPPAATGLSRCPGNQNQPTPTSCAQALADTPVATTGWYESGWTSGESFTR